MSFDIGGSPERCRMTSVLFRMVQLYREDTWNFVLPQVVYCTK